MAKPGRNDRCPCGSGKKYKACCLPKEEEERAREAAVQQTAREARSADRREEQRAVRQAMTRLAMADDDLEEDDLTKASNAAAALVRAGRLDEAEAAARDLIARYPEVHDGWDRLGMVYEARGNSREAADCYRRVLDFLRDNPDYTDDDGLERLFTRLVAKLDPPTATDQALDSDRAP
jgi:tetratricopeptide (TPR) repeat protein